MEALKELKSVVIDMDDIEEGQKEAYLVGRLVTEKHWNPLNLIEAIKKEWKPKHGMSSRVWEESKLILFRFDDAIERDWVLKNQPWLYKGSLFAIEKFTLQNKLQLSSLVNITVEHASFWIRLYDVPFSCMNEPSLSLFAKQIGILECVDTYGEDLFGKFIRFKISTNVTTPLVRQIAIRVKGEHMWLPLKYESLPIFCLSCGIIGHDHKSCQSSNCNLICSNVKLVAPSSKIREETKTIEEAFPRDIVENILSRLPVKYLLRLKVVCKMWEAMISDPEFAETHLRQYKNSTSRNLLACEVMMPGQITYDYGYMESFYKEFHIAELQGHDLEFVTTIEHSWRFPLKSTGILAYCDRLYLIRCFPLHPEAKMYLVWNPSCRAYREIRYTQPLDQCYAYHGIYYHPLMKDYKVVIGDGKSHAIFSCRHNKLSKVMEGFSWCHSSSYRRGVSINGSFYWLDYKQQVGGEGYEYEIICFDWKDEKFKKVPIPDCKCNSVELTSSGVHLNYWYKPSPDELRIMRKDDKDSWMEFNVHVQFNLHPGDVISGPYPQCWVSGDEIILIYYREFFKFQGGRSPPAHPPRSVCGGRRRRGHEREHETIYMIYDVSKSTFARIQIDPSRCSDFSMPLSYLENLFLQ